MDCNIVRDLLPLYIDGCCNEESAKAVCGHICRCDGCRKLFEDMKTPTPVETVTEAPQTLGRISIWRASVLQSVLLFASFALIAFGVAMEARTPTGSQNGVWALDLVIPATGFMLSLANWYFVRLYKSRKRFSDCSFAATLLITLCAYAWAGFHYGSGTFSSLEKFGVGLALTAVFCILSKTLSERYARMLGKE